jgi:hypothetical protein
MAKEASSKGLGESSSPKSKEKCPSSDFDFHRYIHVIAKIADLRKYDIACLHTYNVFPSEILFRHLFVSLFMLNNSAYPVMSDFYVQRNIKMKFL